MVQCLEETAKQRIGLTFVPHLAPMTRGIHATLHARSTSGVDFQKMYQERYANEPFVDVLPARSHPDTRSVRGANLCRIAVHTPSPSSIVVLSVIDNLVKGAAGQAVQNMNLMFGLPETAGLKNIALFP
jgi:N-acetyl-gamma-glutamyl-phosphate reductase